LLSRINLKLYGEIGPAFYDLRTTLLTLLLIALLHIKRPDHLKERDPAAFGILLGLDRTPEVNLHEPDLVKIRVGFAQNIIIQICSRRIIRQALATSWGFGGGK
jgi:hypothetical protein